MLSVNNISQNQNNPSFTAYKFILPKDTNISLYRAMKQLRDSTFLTPVDKKDFFIREAGDKLGEILTFAKGKSGKVYITSIVKDGSSTEKAMLEQIHYHQLTMPDVVKRKIPDKKAKEDVKRFANLVTGK